MNLRKAILSEIPIIWNILQQAIEQRRQDGSQQWQLTNIKLKLS